MDVAAEEPDERAGLKGVFGYGRAISVGVAGVGGKGFGDSVRSGLVDFLEAPDVFVSGGDLRFSEGDFEAGVVSVVGEEGSHADGGVEGIVVCELGRWEEVVPVVLEVVAEGSEVLFEDLIYPLRLAIGLGVERCREAGFDA